MWLHLRATRASCHLLWGIVSLAWLAMTAAQALAQTTDQQHAYFFMGRVQYSKNDGKDCAGVGLNMARLVSEVSSIHIRDEKKVALTDDALFETPFLFMNGHNDFTLTDEELANLRTYLQHGGFLFGSGCCTNPAFPKAWRREMQRLFSQPVKRLEYGHPIYECFYKLGEIRSLHRNTTVYVEGLYLEDRLVAVLCEDGLCCAFSADNTCNVGRGIRPEEGKKLALNIAVYAMTH
ncbi:MAG: DUF4159 domain-containing protein [Pirellulaceae bacterium]|nr:DUF4159 domain-containing protein [Pirellulaceae bacterium]